MVRGSTPIADWAGPVSISFAAFSRSSRFLFSICRKPQRIVIKMRAGNQAVVTTENTPASSRPGTARLGPQG